MIDIVDLIIECYEMGTSNELFNKLQEFSSKDIRVNVVCRNRKESRYDS